MRVDPASLLVPGEWEHQFVPANGTRLHVAEAGDPDRPLVVLLHGFPQTWYAWRAQIPALAGAGYRVAAIDLRGFGSSDKPASGHDALSLAADISAAIRSLGAERAVIVGHGYGAQVAWSMPGLAPHVTRAVSALSSPHPVPLRRPQPWRTTAQLAYAQIPWFPERRLQREWVSEVLRAWSAPGWVCEAEQLYADAMRQPAVAHHVLEQARWQVRSNRRPAGLRYMAAVREPLEVPVLGLHGDLDGCLPSVSRRHDDSYVSGPYSFHRIPDAGHFLPEEAPAAVTRYLLDFLAGLPS